MSNNYSILFSIVIPTYNREKSIFRAVNSVLEQSYKNFEIIIVDDGSTDNSYQVLNQIVDSRVRIIKHSINKGVAAAKNTGMNHIKGDWFTFLDSDDEMLPNALDVFYQVIQSDPALEAITCNCTIYGTNDFSGKGLDKDQYLSFPEIVSKCSGEHWGITKTSLLGNTRFNEAIHGGEDIFWYRIGSNANRYYIHKALRIYHTEGSDRISKKSPLDLEEKSCFFTEISKETDYLETLRKWNRSHYYRNIFNIAIADIIHNRRRDALKKVKELGKYNLPRSIFLLLGIIIGASNFKKIYRLARIVY